MGNEQAKAAEPTLQEEGTTFTIAVSIFQAKGLPAMDDNGKADPYVCVTCGDKKQRSTKCKATLRPVWNQRLEFVFEDERPQNLKLDVFDWDRLTKDDLIGSVQVPITEDDAAVKWYQLGSGNAYLQAQVTCTATRKSSAASLGVYEQVLGLLEVDVVGARHLENARALDIIDPYCEVNFGLKKFVTPTCDNEPNPEWRKLVSLWITPMNANYKIMFSIFDDNAVGDEQRGGHVARAIINASDFAAGTTSDLWIPLTKTAVAGLSDREQSEMKNEEAAAAAAAAEKDSAAAAGGEGEAAADALDLGSITLEEAAPALHIRVTYTLRDVVKERFLDSLIQYFDSDNSGQLSKEEVGMMSYSLGQGADSLAIHTQFDLLDTDGSGALDRAELLNYFNSPAFTSDPLAASLLTFCIHGGDAVRRMVSGVFAEPDAPGSRVGATTLKVMDRSTGLLLREHIPNYILVALKAMYNGPTQSMVDTDGVRAMLVQMSQREGAKMDSPESAHEIQAFVDTHQLNVEELLLPLSEYRTFNEFFYRRLKPGARPITEPDNAAIAVSPADSRITVFPTFIDATTVWVKGSEFTLEKLLSHPDLAGLVPQFLGGSLVIARLSPQDYHRWHFPVTGTIGRMTPINGTLYTVNPIAINKPVNVYTKNTRTVCELETQDFGKVLLIAVGATMVGSVNFVEGVEPGQPCVKGAEHGYFAFGGSTTLMLFQPGKITFDADLLENSAKPLEMLVRVGDRIGIATSALEEEAKAAAQ